ncbi:MAG: GIY-YIG nuclease family protein [Bacteroidales bacterium]|nr:GIY-YIG nuclease family protein [Bacteroidales bacterium]
MKNYYVYILLCSDGSYYTGITNSIDKRIKEHNNSLDKKSYTYNRRPVKIVYQESFQNPNDAILWEKRIKGWTRKKKEALIKKDFEELKKLSNKKSHTSTGSA